MDFRQLKQRLGIKLLSFGAKLYFQSESDKRQFKTSINLETTVGCITSSGGHIRGYVQPMCDFDTQSVINVLVHRKLLNVSEETSEKIEYYSEKWKY